RPSQKATENDALSRITAFHGTATGMSIVQRTRTPAAKPRTRTHRVDTKSVNGGLPPDDQLCFGEALSGRWDSVDSAQESGRLTSTVRLGPRERKDQRQLVGPSITARSGGRCSRPSPPRRRRPRRRGRG